MYPCRDSYTVGLLLRKNDVDKQCNLGYNGFGYIRVIGSVTVISLDEDSQARNYHRINLLARKTYRLIFVEVNHET